MFNWFQLNSANSSNFTNLTQNREKHDCVLETFCIQKNGNKLSQLFNSPLFNCHLVTRIFGVRKWKRNVSSISMVTSYIITFMNVSDSYTDDVCSWLLLLTQGGGVNSALRADMLIFLSAVYSGCFSTGGANIRCRHFRISP